MEKEVYFKELTHRVVGPDKYQISRVSQQARAPSKR